MNISAEETTQLFKPSREVISKSYVKNMEEYKKMYEESIKNPDKFWGKIAEEYVSWYQKWKKVRVQNFTTAEIKWFEGGKLNVSYNCLDRHVENGHGDDIAVIWEGNEPTQDKKFTYKQLLSEVQKFSNEIIWHIKGKCLRKRNKKRFIRDEFEF